MSAIIFDSFDKGNYLEFKPFELITGPQGTVGKGPPTLVENPIVSSIRMPLPKELGDDLEIVYGEIDSPGNAILSAVGNHVKAVGTVHNFVKTAGSYGDAANIPEKQRNFEGLHQSAWTFDWSFIFRSKKEFELISENIALFRRYASGPPNNSTGGAFGYASSVLSSIGTVGGLAGSSFKKPTHWKIKLHSGSEGLGKILTYPKDLIITQVRSHFSGQNGISFFQGGQSPVTIDFSLKFESAKTIMPKDLEPEPADATDLKHHFIGPPSPSAALGK